MSSSYTDGLKVKISEKYKPPRKINLVVSYSQRLSLNKQIQENMPEYSFLLENNILENIQELRNMRNNTLETRKNRLSEARTVFERDCIKRLEEQTKSLEIENKITSTEAPAITSQQQTFLNSGMLMPTQAKYSYSNILTPIPLAQQKNMLNNSDIKRPFNISDFEEDTSSPFDNMELKSINDMEELAQVLKSEARPQISNFNHFNASNTNTNYNIPNNIYVNPVTSSYSHTNGYYYSSAHPSSTVMSFSNSKSIPDIVQSVNKTEVTTLNVANHVNSNLKEKLEDPFDDLSMRDQSLCRNICSMGFPLPRVARACKLLGHDQKKVVEHLLALSYLLDLGFPEGLVSNALLKYDNDKDKALDSLIS